MYGLYRHCFTASIAACASIGKPLSIRTSFTLPSVRITAISTTVPSIRARPASGGYWGTTSWIRFASATREAIRILLTGAGTGDFARTGTLGALFSVSLSAPPGTPPTTPPGTPPGTPKVVPAGDGGSSGDFCTGAVIPELVGMYVDASLGA